MPLHVFLTGATGYLGSAVLRELLDADHRVTALARSDAAATTLADAGAQVVRGDLGDTDSLTAGAAGADAVVHLAQLRLAPGPDVAAGMSELGRVQLGAVRALLAGAREGARVVATSGTGGYGHRGEEVVDEDTPTVDVPMMADMKAAERLVLGTDTVVGAVVRPGIVYGAGGGPLAMVAAQARQAGAAYWVEDGQNSLTLVHRDDVARLYRRVLESPEASGLYNAVSAPHVRQRDLVTAVAGALGLPVMPAPPAVAEQQATGPGVLTHSARVVTRRSGELGWQPRPVDLTEVAAEVSGAVGATAAGPERGQRARRRPRTART